MSSSSEKTSLWWHISDFTNHLDCLNHFLSYNQLQSSHSDLPPINNRKINETTYLFWPVFIDTYSIKEKVIIQKMYYILNN